MVGYPRGVQPRRLFLLSDNKAEEDEKVMDLATDAGLLPKSTAQTPGGACREEDET